MRRDHGLLLLISGLALALAACRRDESASHGPSSNAASASAAPPAPRDGVPDAAAACAPLAVETVTPLATCTSKVVKTPVPAIEDPSGTLASFYERLAELERGTAKRTLRIAIYGDSNLTSDFLSAHLRRVLQGRYGDAGHGWVSLSRPWGSYRHEDVVMAGYWPMFKLYAPTTHVATDKQYGFANMAAESSEIGAAAWAATAKDPKAKVGRRASHFELHYLKQPRGGSFRIEVDRKELRTIATKAPAFEAGIASIEVEDGAHELRCVVRGDGRVRLFGVSLDRSPELDRDADPDPDAGPDAGAPSSPGSPGVQVDSLGAGALNYQRLTWVANETRRAQLARRDYDLVILWLGTNVMFVPPNKEWAKTFIGELRAALPETPVLVFSPGDTARDGETKSNPRIVAVVKQMREVAAETKAAFWDFRDAMGGDGSIIGFTKRGLTGADHIHFGPEGSRLMADRFLCSLSSSLSTYLVEHREAGCSTSGERENGPRWPRGPAAASPSESFE